MKLRGFAAESSLYRPGHVYREYSGAAGADVAA
jgi:hypothetical protein